MTLKTKRQKNGDVLFVVFLQRTEIFGLYEKEQISGDSLENDMIMS